MLTGALPMRLLAVAPIALLAACGGEAEPKTAAPPSKTELVAHDTELLKITLSPEAEARLGIAVEQVGSVDAVSRTMANGEVVGAPPSGGVPVSAATDLNALAANQAAADGAIARAKASVEVARQAAQRAEALVAAEAGSERAAEEARGALAVANADLRAAQRQRGLLGQSPTQLAGRTALWVRASVFAADLDRVVTSAPAIVSTLGDTGAQVSARPVSAPPSGDPAAGTVDLFYALPASGGAFRIGQRVSVALPVAGERSRLSVPASSILHDINGNTWVYARTAARSYERRRVEVASIAGGRALLARGVDPGTAVVTAGAAELFGTEFGAK